jgi:hypothetical protein
MEFVAAAGPGRTALITKPVAQPNVSTSMSTSIIAAIAQRCVAAITPLRNVSAVYAASALAMPFGTTVTRLTLTVVKPRSRLLPIVLPVQQPALQLAQLYRVPAEFAISPIATRSWVIAMET